MALGAGSMLVSREPLVLDWAGESSRGSLSGGGRDTHTITYLCSRFSIIFQTKIDTLKIPSTTYKSRLRKTPEKPLEAGLCFLPFASPNMPAVGPRSAATASRVYMVYS